MKKIFRKNNKLTVILRSEADFDKCEVEYTECTSEHVLCKSSTECDLHKQIKTRSKNFELSIIQDSEASSGSYQLLNNTPSRSDSEHTQSSQTCNDERFRMTTYFTIDSCLRCRRGTSRTYQDARRVRLTPQNDEERMTVGLKAHPTCFRSRGVRPLIRMNNM